MKQQFLMNRRHALSRAAAMTLATMPATGRGMAAEAGRRTGMGLVIYNCNFRRKWLRQQDPANDLFEPLTFLKHCHRLGAGGMQVGLGILTSREIESLRQYADQHDLFVDAIVKPPKDDQDLARFEAEIKTAGDVGVQAVRTTIIPGRRYERFKQLSEFREFEKRGREMLQRAVPVVERYRVPFAVENHKDQRIDERVELLESLSSEFIGACVDTGNSFALLDGAYEPIEALAPYALSVHLKDQALLAYHDGFLLGDVPLGQGSFDLKRMVEILRKQKPGIKFVLELITRDALKVPCMTNAFYRTMPQTPAIDLARTMQFVRKNSVQSVRDVSGLTLREQVEREAANVDASIRYAGEELQI